jgi:nucleoside-diphosphate-sugar epimerase
LIEGKTVLVTGATGFLGSATVRRLAERGTQVRALVRSPEKSAFLRQIPNVSVVFGDLTKPDTLRAAVEGCDVVMHTAVAYGSRDEQQAVNVEGTRNIAKAAAQALVERFVHVSSIAVYGYALDHDATEYTPMVPRSHDPYAETKANAERALQKVAGDTGLVFTVIRPGYIYGPGSGMWTERVFRIASMRTMPFVGDGRGRAHPIYVDDVVDMMALLARHAAARGEAFNCTPDPAPSWREWLRLYQQLNGRESWLALPPWLLQPAANAVGLFAPAGTRTKEAPHVLRLMQSRVTYRMDKPRNMLNWRPQVTLADGVARCAPWLRERGLLA